MQLCILHWPPLDLSLHPTQKRPIHAELVQSKREQPSPRHRVVITKIKTKMMHEGINLKQASGHLSRDMAHFRATPEKQPPLRTGNDPRIGCCALISRRHLIPGQ